MHVCSDLEGGTCTQIPRTWIRRTTPEPSLLAYTAPVKMFPGRAPRIQLDALTGDRITTVE